MNYRIIELPASSIKNGRIYFSASDVKFFPADSFGDRQGAGHKGNAVEFIAGGESFQCDIRVSSGKRLSPRSSFLRFLKTIGAVKGERLKVRRVADRKYQIEHIGQ